ncbi:hypothetical protein JCM6882_005043 [Rhodosporidiobolus microsporus]
MSRAATPRPFDAAASAESLKSLFNAELDAVHRAPAGAPNRPEIFKPAQQAAGGAWGGGAAQWGQTKPGAMADGKDFLQTLAAAVEKAKGGAGASTPAPAKPNNSNKK